MRIVSTIRKVKCQRLAITPTYQWMSQTSLYQGIYSTNYLLIVNNSYILTITWNTLRTEKDTVNQVDEILEVQGEQIESLRESNGEEEGIPSHRPIQFVRSHDLSLQETGIAPRRHSKTQLATIMVMLYV